MRSIPVRAGEYEWIEDGVTDRVITYAASAFADA